MKLLQSLNRRSAELRRCFRKAQLKQIPGHWWMLREKYIKREIQHSVQVIAGQTSQRNLDRLINARGRTIATVTGKDVSAGGLGISAVKLHLLQSMFPQYYHLSPPEESEAYAMIETMRWLREQTALKSLWPLNRETYEWVRFGSSHSLLLSVDDLDAVPRHQRIAMENEIVEFSHRLDAFRDVFAEYAVSVELMELPAQRSLVPTSRSGIGNLLELVTDWGPSRLVIAEEIDPQRTRLDNKDLDHQLNAKE